MKKILFIIAFCMAFSFHFAFAQCENSSGFAVQLSVTKKLAAQLDGLIDISPMQELQAFNAHKKLLESIKSNYDLASYYWHELDLDGLDCLSEKHQHQIDSISNASPYIHRLKDSKFISQEVKCTLNNDGDLRIVLNKKLSDYSLYEKALLISRIHGVEGVKSIIGISQDDFDLALKQLKDSGCSVYVEFEKEYRPLFVLKK